MTPDLATSPIIVDLETCGLPNAAEFLEPVTPDARLKDPEKIKADIRDKEEARMARLSLDPNVGRIAAIGWWTEEAGYVGHVCPSEMNENHSIRHFWEESKRRTIVGFNVRGFDLRFLVQRSRYLRIHHPILDFSKYSRKSGIIDLFSELTFGDGTYDQGAMRRTLRAFAKRFGIPCTDTVEGKDIPALVEKGEWEAVAAHVKADVEMTLALAVRLGVVREAAVGAF